ncbi:hypothetical protein EU528_14310 [Candidatus Thorarchaeota archaeon]|nr:MAG: hypothetical protein EU528_14310 [Candidatus Thorarchaeota archaeon]
MFPENHTFTLSEESPTYSFNISLFQVGISTLQTNNTPVSIVVRNQHEVIFNVTNIRALSDYYIEITNPGSQNGWWLEVVRQDADVTVNLTTHYWIILIPAVMLPLFPIWAIPVGIGLVIYALYMMFKEYTGITSDNDKDTKFLAIILLLIIGPLFCYPLVRGTIDGDFTPVSTLISVPDETYLFTLNVTHPITTIDLSVLYPEEGSSASFKIHSITSSEYPIQLSVSTDSTYNLTLEQESNNDDWWIIIPSEVNSSTFLGLERVDADSNIEIGVETQYRILIPREDITIPVIFSILGFSGIIVALFIAYGIDRNYNDELHNSVNLD